MRGGEWGRQGKERDWKAESTGLDGTLPTVPQLYRDRAGLETRSLGSQVGTAYSFTSLG